MKTIPFQQILNKINPHCLFLIDSLGALLSAIMLGLILARFENTFGMPPEVLYFLVLVACVFSVYSFLCFLSKTGNWKPFMKTIAVANLVYCCVTIGLIIHFYQSLTILGFIYFTLEIIVVCVLVLIEQKALSMSV